MHPKFSMEYFARKDYFYGTGR